MSADPVGKAAAALAAAWESNSPRPPVREWIDRLDADSAYAVQDIGTNARLERGARIVGRKIGLTSPAVQKQLGVDRPDFGVLFDDMDVPLGAVIEWTRVMQPRIEAEVAFTLKTALDGDRLTSADVIAAVDYVLPAFEIVGSRIANWDISLADTIADNASAGLYVLGHTPRRLHEVDVVSCQLAMSRRGEVVSTGSGEACLGSPLSALLWLAREMVARGRSLQRGEVILSGALGPMVVVSPGDVFEAEISGIGKVSARFGDVE